MRNIVNEDLARKGWQSVYVTIGDGGKRAYTNYTFPASSFDLNSVMRIEETESKLIYKARDVYFCEIRNGITRQRTDEEREVLIVIEKLE
ncbi:hypothetical protein [Paenibacillus sp. 32O-W]|uniref:hypothetical protein n=1 Tax=Paenibacillus sp. 32O-W TaxID=1695218 RepID=UPI0011AE8E78|nr:hypothetical protein [Paenibacillus sp. 32O-W]